MDYFIAILSIGGIHILLGLSVYLVAITGQLSFGQQGFSAVGAYLAGMGTAMWGLHLLPAVLIGTVSVWPSTRTASSKGLAASGQSSCWIRGARL